MASITRLFMAGASLLVICVATVLVLAACERRGIQSVDTIMLDLEKTYITPSTDVAGTIRGVSLSPSGSLAIRDDVSDHVFLLDSLGSVERIVGRSGRGPGEFSEPPTAFSLGHLHNGLLLAVDGMSRINSWLPNGEPGPTILSSSGFVTGLGTYGNSAVVKISTGPNLDVVEYKYPFSEPAILRWSSRKLRRGTPCQVCPFAVSKDGEIALSLSMETFQIVTIEPERGRYRLLEKDYPPLKIGDSELSRMRSMPGPAASRVQIPRSFPMVVGLTYDGRGRLWVARQVRKGSSRIIVYEHYNPQTDLLAAVLEGTPRTRLMSVFDGTVLIVHERDDEQQIQFLQMLEEANHE